MNEEQKKLLEIIEYLEADFGGLREALKYELSDPENTRVIDIEYITEEMREDLKKMGSLLDDIVKAFKSEPVEGQEDGKVEPVGEDR